jgi:hypothetical protein
MIYPAILHLEEDVELGRRSGQKKGKNFPDGFACFKNVQFFVSSL